MKIFGIFTKLFFYSVIFILKLGLEIKEFVSSIVTYYKYCIISFFKILLNYGEENFIKSKIKEISKIPVHIALIVNNKEYNEYRMIKLLTWIMYIKKDSKKIKCLTIYDPFGIINKDSLVKTCNYLFDSRITFEDSLDEKRDLFVNIINYNKANKELIKKCIKNQSLLCDGYPKEFYVSESLIKEQNLKKNNYSQFYTLKEAEYLPEIVLVPTSYKKGISLYGFPFTLLENSEIM